MPCYDDVPVNSDTLLLIDFMNLKIKPAQFFRGDHRIRLCVFIGVVTHMYISIYIYNVFISKIPLFHASFKSSPLRCKKLT
jgi:hypothetical protein